jgi:dTMP kinase
MENHPGIFLVLEGADGSGKGTQFKLLTERLKAVGYDVATFDFPRYEQPSSHFVRKYLNGEYGPASSVNPYTASMFYALDRYEAAKDINQALAAGKVVLSNRYVGSNMAHQGSKFTSQAEQRGFFLWADSLEYQLLGIPRPTLNLFLKLPAELSYELIAEKAARSYTKNIRDEHEKDINHLRSAVGAYELLCRLFPKDFETIECAKDNRLLSVPEINDKIWSAIQPLLSGIPKHQPHSKTLNIDTSSVQSNSVQRTPEDTGLKKKPAAFDQISLGRVSLLLKRELLRVPGLKINIAASISQKKQAGLNSGWKLPRELDASHSNSLSVLLEHTNFVYSKLSTYLDTTIRELEIDKQALLLHATRGLRPLFSEEEVIVQGGPETFSRLLEALSASGTQESAVLANKVSSYLGSGAVDGRNLKKETSLVELEAIINDLPTHSSSESYIELETIRPRNELDVISEIIYSYSGLKMSELQQYIDQLSYQQKSQIFVKLLKDQSLSGNVLGTKVSYGFEVLSDGLTMVDTLSSGQWSEIQIQAATPRYGYDIPQIVEVANLAEQYSACFDSSLELYSSLQSQGHHAAAQYAVLEGHRAHWQAEITADSLNITLQKLRRTPRMHKDSSRLLFKIISEKIAEAHPLIHANLLSVPLQTKTNQPITNKPATTVKSRNAGKNQQSKRPRRGHSRRRRSPGA